MRRVESHDHQDPRHQSRDWQGQQPAGEDKGNLSPVNSTQAEIHQRHTNSRTGKALRRGHGQTEPTRQQDGDGGAQLHGEATRGG